MKEANGIDNMMNKEKIRIVKENKSHIKRTYGCTKWKYSD